MCCNARLIGCQMVDCCSFSYFFLHVSVTVCEEELPLLVFLTAVDPAFHLTVKVDALTLIGQGAKKKKQKKQTQMLGAEVEANTDR